MGYKEVDEEIKDVIAERVERLVKQDGRGGVTNLASFLGVRHSHVWNIMRKGSVSVVTLVKIAAYYGKPLDYFIPRGGVK